MKISDYNPLKRCLVFFLAMTLAIPIVSMPTAVHAASFSDLGGHWADQHIKNAVSKGFVAGYPDGTFCPDKSVTRAEFASMINKALGNTGTATISFKDVPSSEWYYKEVAKSISAAYAGGYDDNTFRPNSPVSRQEAAVMLSRIIPTYGSSANLKTYPDSSSVSDWATTAMSKVCGKGYMGAYKDGKLHPLDNITRAQTAKILCDVLDSESIVSGATTVRSGGTTLSNKVYSNDVILHSDLGNGEATLSNCIVLGTLYVYGGGENTVTVKNSRIANAVVEKASSGVRLLAQGEAVVANASASKTAILETSGLSGGLYGTGFNLVNVKGSADATLKGSFVRVNVVGASAKVNLASGAISTLNVESAGKNSDITVASNATVTTTNVNGAAAFHGPGTINTMNANTSGITYETKPKNVKTSNSSYNPGVGSGTSSSTIGDITISPKTGATNMAVDDKITLSFNSAATKYNGTALTSSNIDDVIELRKKTSSGTKVGFSASINSAKKVITITPTNDFDEDTKYYVVINKNALKIGDNGNAAFSSYFTTDDEGNGSSTMNGITISPKKGATSVKVNSKITLTFDYAVTKYNGSALTSSNLEDLIELHKKTESGTEVDFSASINSAKKVITITPDDDFDEDTKYYVTIDKNALKFDGSGNSAFSSYFTTNDGSSGSSTINGITISPKRGATGVDVDTEIKLTFDSAVTKYSGSALTNSNIESIIEIHKKTSGGTEIDFEASINSSKKVITITPDDDLDEDTKYYVTIDKNELKFDGNGNSEFSSYFTTGDDSDSDVTFSPKKGATGVSTSVDPTIKFSSDIETYAGKSISNSYLSSSVITFREGSDSGSKVSFSASYNSSKKTITIDPSSKLKEGQKYYLAIESKKFRTKSGEKNISKTSITFTVAGASVDTSSIDTAIASANAAKSNVKVSIDGADVRTEAYWVTQEQMNTLTSAITTASNAKSTVTTVAQAQSAAAALNVSTETFKSNKKKGTKPQINTTSLSYAITDADSAKSGILVSTDGFDVSPSQSWVTQTTLDALTTAISSAKSAMETIETASQLMSSIDTLNSAVNTFNSQINSGKKSDKTDLKTAISTANTTIGQVRMQNSADGLSAGTKWVTSAEYKVLADQIEAAIAINAKRDATQSEIDAATSALKTAKDNFPVKIAE